MRNHLAVRVAHRLMVLSVCGVTVLIPAGTSAAEVVREPAGPVLFPLGQSTLGDYVWHDSNLDGDHTGAEAEWGAEGIDAVLVNLYLDANLNGEIDSGEYVTIIEEVMPTPTTTPTPTPPPPCVDDPYEVDDSCGQSNPITVNGAPQHHNFSKQFDEDWLRFEAVAGVEYTIRTSNLAGAVDTALWVFDSDCTTLLAYNDDASVGDVTSRIVHQAAHSGTVYVKVTEFFNRGDCGSYDLSITGGLTEYRVYLPVVVRSRPVPRTPTPTRPAGGLRHPKVVAVNPRTHRVYVSSRDNNSLMALDGQTMAVLGQVPVGSEPFGVTVNVNTNKVYVACFDSDDVYVVDGTSLAVLKHFGVGDEPTFVAVNPDTNRIYVALHGTGGVTVIDGATDTVTNILGTGAGTFGIAVNRNLNRVYVSARDVNTIRTIDGVTNAVLGSQTVQLGPSRSVPFELEYNESSQKLYVLYGPNIPNKVWVYGASASGLTSIKSLDVGNGGHDGGGGIVANPTSNYIYVTNSAENSVSIINGALDMLVGTIYHPVEYLQDPYGIGVDPFLNSVYVVNRSATSVTRFPGW